MQVTPMQLARATATLANQGQVVTPYIAERIVDDSREIAVKHSPATNAGEKAINSAWSRILNAISSSLYSSSCLTVNTCAVPVLSRKRLMKVEHRAEQFKEHSLIGSLLRKLHIDIPLLIGLLLLLILNNMNHRTNDILHISGLQFDIRCW
jgi:membrane carboxypeptidase/penicillin-binding protein